MSAQLYLAANIVSGTFVFGHLQIVYDDGSGNLFETETTSTGALFFGDWEWPPFGQAHDDAANTPGYGDPEVYAITPLTLRDGQDSGHVWELLGQINSSIFGGDYGIDYDLDQNSNSYAYSMLQAIGIDAVSYLDAVTAPQILSFPGFGRDILLGAKTGGLFSGYDTPIALTLAGTAGDDYVQAGIGDDRIGGGGGDDDLHGGAGNDRLKGGSGEDILEGGAGDDLLLAQKGGDLLTGDDGDDQLRGGGGDDRLEGGNGDDLLDGGWGHDTMAGGDGADTFVFWKGRDLIEDFELGTDLLVLSADLFDTPLSAQEVVDLYGVTDGQHTLLDFGKHELGLFDLSDLDALANDILIL